MLPSAPRRATRLAALASTAVLVLTGCSGGDETAPEDSGTSSSPASSESAGAGSGAEGRATEVTGTVPDVEEPVASRTVGKGGDEYRLDVFPLVTGEGSPGVSANVRLVFEKMNEPDVPQGLLASIEDQGSVRMRRASGLQLVDHAGGKAYLPSLDAEGVPLCSPELPVEANEGDQVYVTCVFGGLDEDVESLDLVVPNFGTFRDVPTR